MIDEASIRLTAIHTLFDFFLVFGTEVFDVAHSLPEECKIYGEETDPCVENGNHILELVLGSLLLLLESNDSEAQVCVVEGFCRLIFSEKLQDSHIFPRLVIIFFTLKENFRIQQILSVFFGAYSQFSVRVSDQCRKALIPCLNSLLDTGQYSLIVPVFRFFLGLCSLESPEVSKAKQDPPFTCEKDENSKTNPQDKDSVGIHDHYARLVSELIIEISPQRALRELVKCLVSVRVDGNCQENIQYLRRLNRIHLKRIKAKADKNLLINFDHHLESLETDSADEWDEYVDAEEDPDDALQVEDDANLGENMVRAGVITSQSLSSDLLSGASHEGKGEEGNSKETNDRNEGGITRGRRTRARVSGESTKQEQFGAKRIEGKLQLDSEIEASELGSSELDSKLDSEFDDSF